MADIMRRVHHRDHFKIVRQARPEFFANTLRPWVGARCDMNTHSDKPGFKDRRLEPRIDARRHGPHHGAEAVAHERDAVRSTSSLASSMSAARRSATTAAIIASRSPSGVPDPTDAGGL